VTPIFTCANAALAPVSAKPATASAMPVHTQCFVFFMTCLQTRIAVAHPDGALLRVVIELPPLLLRQSM
jgi:hypothetical protein